MGRALPRVDSNTHLYVTAPGQTRLLPPLSPYSRPGARLRIAPLPIKVRAVAKGKRRMPVALDQI